MKKTLTVNLANTVYHIDEDAYHILQSYFEKLRKHFTHEKDAEEIMSDIEARVGELFNERLSYGMQVISEKEVNEIIVIMGSPNDFDNSTNETTGTQETSDNQSTSEGKKFDEPQKVTKRLYRDTEDAFLGGVCNGLSIYLNIDVVFVRLFFVLFIFAWATTIPIYIVMWIVIREAKTAAQKLEMRGEAPTIENIKNFVKENVERVATNAEKELKSERTQTFLQQLGIVMVSVIQALAKVIMALIGGFFGCLGLSILLAILFSLAISLPFILTDNAVMPMQINGWQIGNWIYYPQFTASILIFLGIPVVLIAYSVFQKLLNWKKISKTVNWIIVIVWLISFFTIVYFGANEFIKYNQHSITIQ